MAPTVREELARATARLRAAGATAGDAAVDADVLVRHVLGWDRATLLLRRDEAMAPAVRDTFTALVERRAHHEPVAYLIGTREFYGRAFTVAPAVLIPRPETELIVDDVLQRTAPDAVLRVADVCTGSGILAVTLAAERPGATVLATDISDAALAVARHNALAHAVADRITFVEADLLAPTPGPFDVIVANPPYVARRDASGLAPDVRDFEPALALFGGDEGLEVIGRLVRQAAKRLAPEGMFVMEFGAGQQYDVVHHLKRAGLDVLQILTDLQGIARVVVCRPRADT